MRKTRKSSHKQRVKVSGCGFFSKKSSTAQASLVITSNLVGCKYDVLKSKLLPEISVTFEYLARSLTDCCKPHDPHATMWHYM